MTEVKLAIGSPGWWPEKVHPWAELFPITEEAVAELTEDIMENGLRHPLVIDADGTLIDGRMRRDACKRAGVEPRYIFLNGHDPKRVILSENVKRRQMTQGQLAMIAARAFLITPEKELEELLSKLDNNSDPDPDKKKKRGRPKGTSDGKQEFAKLAGVPQSRFQEALTVHQFAPDLAADVIAANSMTLEKAYAEAKDRKKEAKWRDDGLAQLRAVAPDIAGRVRDGEIDVEAGRKEYEERERADALVRDSLFMRLSNFCRAAEGFENSEVLPQFPEWLKREDAQEQFQRYFKKGPEQFIKDMDQMQRAIDAIRAVATNLEVKKEEEKS